jgi:hypothetical protein
MNRKAVDAPPRLLDKAAAASYMGGISVDQVDRLINTGALSVVKLPATRGRTQNGCRRVLIDRLEVDALVDRWREKRS